MTVPRRRSIAACHRRPGNRRRIASGAGVQGRRTVTALRPFLTGENPRAYRDLAQQLNKNEGALRTAVHRLRQEFGEAVKFVIGQTVAHPDQIESELAELTAALRAKAS